jgi:hypothetical protein
VKPVSWPKSNSTGLQIADIKSLSYYVEST